MKAFIVFLFSFGCLFAADDIKVTVNVTTNARTGAVTTKEYFTRNGETNLLRSTRRTNGVIQSQLHLFYHDRKWAGTHLVEPAKDRVDVSSYNFNLHTITQSNSLRSAWIGDRRDGVLDVFVLTNGSLVPIPTSELRKLTNSWDSPKTDQEEK